MTGFGPQMPVYAELAPGVRRLLAPNPSMMTGPGTNTYLLGVEEVAVLDPGPDIESHRKNIVEYAQAPVRWVLVTHTHPDHSPGARRLAEQTGAQILGRAAPEHGHQDAAFTPDRVLDDGERLRFDDVPIEVLHTPGHASNHLCYRHVGLNWVFTGDHVIDGSTVVIDPPDGNMRQYLRSLERVRDLHPAALAPGHGELIEDSVVVIDGIIEHRLGREAKVLTALRGNPGLSPAALVPYVYRDVPERLYGLAERSLLAHLLKLAEDGAAVVDNDTWHATSG